MKKNQIRGLTVILIILAVFSVISFLLPFKTTGMFWLSYIFGAASVLVQIYVLKTAFCGSNEVKSKFYGFPIARIGVVYMIAQLILSIIFMILADFAPWWIAVIAFVVLLAAALIGFISSDAMRDEIEQDRIKGWRSALLVC